MQQVMCIVIHMKLIKIGFSEEISKGIKCMYDLECKVIIIWNLLIFYFDQNGADLLNCGKL